MRSFPAFLLAMVFGWAGGCGAGGNVEHSERPDESPVADVGDDPLDEPLVEGDRYQDTDCDDPLPIYRDGEVVGRTCEARAEARGLSILDLSDGFTPRIFSEDPNAEVGRQPYRTAYLALADERFRNLPPHVAREQFLELYGIFPTFRVLHGRLGNEERHACHDAVDDAALADYDEVIRPWSAHPSAQRRRVRALAHLESTLERAARTRRLESIDELEGDGRYGRMLERFRDDTATVAVIAATQAHLECDELIQRRHHEGVFDWPTVAGLRDYQQLVLVVSPGFIDESTRAVMQRDSRENDFAAVLRTLRERVVSATGLIEDGSARDEHGTILGRTIDPEEFHANAGHDPLGNGAPDLVSPATEAAARALGWTSPQAFVSFVDALGDGGTADLRVAVRLPPRPSYHSRHMELRAEVDRGDVWYAYPYTSSGGFRGQRVQRRPTLTLFATDGDREVALVRWATTIGGWKPESLPDGGVGLRYKNSPAGERIWRDVIASPAWLPPPATPADELVRGPSGGPYRPRYDLFGPGYRSAYGLTMVMHHKVIEPEDEDGEVRYVDEGIRAHGSVSYRSILRGTSHGCHRLYNHLAVRLSSFLLAHRNHERRGYMPAAFTRNVVMERKEEGEDGEEIELDPQEITIRLETRGYRFELTPPVPVNVLEGNVRGPVTQPPAGFRRLREELVAEALAEAAEDG